MLKVNVVPLGPEAVGTNWYLAPALIEVVALPEIFGAACATGLLTGVVGLLTGTVGVMTGVVAVVLGVVGVLVCVVDAVPAAVELLEGAVVTEVAWLPDDFVEVLADDA
jgi:hypothetical protein